MLKTCRITFKDGHRLLGKIRSSKCRTSKCVDAVNIYLSKVGRFINSINFNKNHYIWFSLVLDSMHIPQYVNRASRSSNSDKGFFPCCLKVNQFPILNIVSFSSKSLLISDLCMPKKSLETILNNALAHISNQLE